MEMKPKRGSAKISGMGGLAIGAVVTFVAFAGPTQAGGDAVFLKAFYPLG